MKLFYSFALAIPFFFIFPFIVRADTIDQQIEQNYTASTTPDQIRVILADIMGSTSPMLAVVGCESGFRQYNGVGDVLESSTSDMGLFQINPFYWGAKARSLGYDIKTIDGNIHMGIFIYKTAGISQWTCAKILGII